MTEFVNDNIQVSMEIGGEPWLVSEAKVVLTKAQTPNYVELSKIAPDIDNGAETSDPSTLVGKDFELSVDNSLVSDRDVSGDGYKRLFKGKVANISNLGTGVYEGIAYDPSQEIFGDSQQSGGGSLLNQTIDISQPKEGNPGIFDYPYLNEDGELSFGRGQYKYASEYLSEALSRLPIQETEIDLQKGGVTITGPRGEYTHSTDKLVTFEEGEKTIGQLLSDLAKKTNSRIWFDKNGVFHFGQPEPSFHKLRYITDTSAGLTTPPYQSIKVIGSGLASESGYGGAQRNPDSEFAVGANITTQKNGNEIVPQYVALDSSDAVLQEPTFTYRNNEIMTIAEAEDVIQNLSEKLGEQYKSGTITVVGYPEIDLFDVVIMPHAKQSQQDIGNFNERQPMGGGIFGVYKLVHKLNPTDGFITEISTMGMTGPASVLISDDEFVRQSSFVAEQTDEVNESEYEYAGEGIPGDLDQDSSPWKKRAAFRYSGEIDDEAKAGPDEEDPDNGEVIRAGPDPDEQQSPAPDAEEIINAVAGISPVGIGRAIFQGNDSNNEDDDE